MTTLEQVQEEIKRQLIGGYPSMDKSLLTDMLTLGLAEEAGEVSGLRKREIRKKLNDSERSTKEKYVEELGDVLWYLTALCVVKDISLEEMWKYNYEKLMARYG